MKLTAPMLSALRKMNETYAATNIHFRSGEALRRRGLAERYTEYLVKAVYVQSDVETVQYEHPASAPLQHHEWYITPAGRRALAKRGEVG